MRCAADDRPALANDRVQCNAAGQVVRKRKTAWRDGTTLLVMSPLEFMQRLAALAPTPSCARWCAAGARGACPSCGTCWVRGELCAPPCGAAELGPAAQASARARSGVLPELRWRAQDLRGDPGAASDREDPHAPGTAGACAALGAGPSPGAATGLTIPIHHRSRGPQSRATGIGCARGFSGPKDVARRQAATRR